MSYKRFMCILLVLLVALFAFAGCSKKTEEGGTESNNGVPEVVQPAGQSQPAVNQSICPLTGLPEDEKSKDLRPIAVMMDNERNARPQSGLYAADIVYEMPAEGNITRYMAIFHHQDAEKIGPVRSARPYFINKALEFGAVYVHCGGSPQALKDLATLKVDTLNDLKGSPCFWRSKDRKMPHNLYTSTKLMRSVMASKKLEDSAAPAYFKFSEAFLNLPNGTKAGHVSIAYDKNYKAGYEYDESQKLYFRTINGTRLKDKDTGKEISTTNIIIEKTTAKVLDSAGRLEVLSVGSGSGYYLTGGNMIEIKWSKSSRSGRTVYTDLTGNEIQLNKGVTWIQVVPSYNSIEIKE